MRYTLFRSLIVITVCLIGLSATALAKDPNRCRLEPSECRELRADRKEISADKKEFRADRHEIRRDRGERRSDVRDYRVDRREGASQQELRADRREIRADRRDVGGDSHELRQDRRDLRGDARDFRRDWRGARRNYSGTATLRKMTCSWVITNRDEQRWGSFVPICLSYGHSCLPGFSFKKQTAAMSVRPYRGSAIRHLRFANSSWKCTRTLFVASPHRGEMFIAWRSLLYS